MSAQKQYLTDRLSLKVKNMCFGGTMCGTASIVNLMILEMMPGITWGSIPAIKNINPLALVTLINQAASMPVK